MSIVCNTEAVVCEYLKSLTKEIHNQVLSPGKFEKGQDDGFGFGYGVDFENDVFMIHTFCWCDGEDCPWCNGKPNFLHKKTGASLSWYKYIGRGMVIDEDVNWSAVFAECFSSLQKDFKHE